MTNIDEDEVIDILDKFENEFKIIKYSKKSKEIAILNWEFYNLNNLGGKPIMDCIRSELRMVKDRSLIPEILKGIKKDDIRKLFIEAMEEGNKDIYESREFKSTNKFKEEDISFYAKPSEEQLRRARELYS